MFELSVAFRFLREGRMQTLLILVAISVGIAVQVFLSALIGGLQKDLIFKTVGTAPHLTGSAPDRRPTPLFPETTPTITRTASGQTGPRLIREWEPVVRELRAAGLFLTVSPTAMGSGFAFRGGQSRPVVLKGMLLDQADSIYHIRERMAGGTAEISGNGLLMGRGLADELRLKPGETVRIAASTGAEDLFTVRGVFDLESKPVNDSWIILPLFRAQSLLNFGNGISAIETQVPDVFEAQAVGGRTAESFPTLDWISWQESNAGLLTALKSQSSSSNLIQILVILAVTLGISSVLAVSAIQKARQIGILKAMGEDNRSVSLIFLIMGFLLGLAGSLLGCAGGYALIYAFLKGTAAATGKPLFPLSVSFSLFAGSALIATLASTIAAFAPARRASRLNPMEVIRNG